MRSFAATTGTALLLVSGMAAAVVPRAGAEQSAAGGGVQPAVTTIQPAAPSQPRAMTEVINVSFGGGPVADYVNAIRKSAGQLPVNISVTDEASRVVIPAVNLQSVSLATAVTLLENVTEERGARLGVKMASTSLGTEPAFIVTSRKPAPPARAGEGEQRLIVSLTDLMNAKGGEPAQQDKQLQTILSAVQAALEIGREASGPVPQISVHKESGLLLMLGSEEDRRTVMDAIEQMQLSVNRGGGPSKQKTIQLINAAPGDAVEAWREVFPDRFGNSERPITFEEVNAKTVKVTAPAAIMPGVEAIALYVDRVRSDPKEVAKVREEMVTRERKLEAYLNTVQEELKRRSDQMSALEAQLMAARQEASEMRSRLDMKQNEVEVLAKRLKDAEAQKPR